MIRMEMSSGIGSTVVRQMERAICRNGHYFSLNGFEISSTFMHKIFIFALVFKKQGHLLTWDDFLFHWHYILNLYCYRRLNFPIMNLLIMQSLTTLLKSRIIEDLILLLFRACGVWDRGKIWGGLFGWVSVFLSLLIFKRTSLEHFKPFRMHKQHGKAK